MPVTAYASTSNIKLSLDEYVQTYLGTSEGLSVDYEGVKFDDKAVNEWIQPRIVGINSIWQGKAGNNEYAERTNVLYQINIFVKKSGISKAHRHYQIRDHVVDYFPLLKDITMHDYVRGGTTIVEYMRIRNMANDGPIIETNELCQYVIAWDIDFIRRTTLQA